MAEVASGDLAELWAWLQDIDVSGMTAGELIARIREAFPPSPDAPSGEDRIRDAMAEARPPRPHRHQVTMTAEQLINAAITCVTCGKIHEPKRISPHQQTWAGDDGHPYRTRIFAMTGDSHGRAIEALRLIAAQGV